MASQSHAFAFIMAAFCALVFSHFALHVAADDVYVQAATAFCNSPDFYNQTCGWVEDNTVINSTEDQQVLNSTSVFSGTMWAGWYNTDAQKNKYPPVTRSANPNYFQYLGRVLSLACRGQIQVSVVFKRLSQGEQGCAGLIPAPNSDTVSNEIIRCEVVLPEGASADAAAATANTTNCVQCSTCGSDGPACPLESDKWYRDAATIAIPQGCPPEDSPSVAAIVMDPAVIVRIASFEVGSVTASNVTDDGTTGQ